MFIDVPVLADLEAIRQRRQALIDSNLAKQNRKRYDYHYKVGDHVYVKKYDPRKSEERMHGPYPILECRTNGTVVLRRLPNGLIDEVYNIRKLVPFKGAVRSTNTAQNFYVSQVQKLSNQFVRNVFVPTKSVRFKL